MPMQAMQLPPLLMLLLVLAASDCRDVTAAEQSKTDELISFAHAYGVLRYFHPTDEAAAVDWSMLAVHGVEEILGSTTDLQSTLLRVFSPIAPTLLISQSKDLRPVVEQCRPDESVVAWQHFGIANPRAESVFASRRVNRTSEDRPLFDDLLSRSEVFTARISDELFLAVPLTVCATTDESARTSEQFEALVDSISKFDHTDPDLSSTSVQVANTIIVWNVAKYFYPYFDEVGVDWDSVLSRFVRDALAPQTSAEHVDALRHMVSFLQDGHGLIFPAPSDAFGNLRLRLEYVGEDIVVSASQVGAIPVGSELISIDGQLAREKLAQWKRLVSGSPQTRTYRALNMVGSGPAGSEATVEVRLPIGEIVKVALVRDRRANLFHGDPQFDYPALTELEDGGCLINLRYFGRSDLAENMAQLSSAPYVVIDMRWGGKDWATQFDIFGHLFDETLDSPTWLVPNVSHPAPKTAEYSRFVEHYYPTQPAWAGDVAFLTNASVVSSSETILGMVEAYGLAYTVGQRTAGTNGNSNMYPLIGLTFQWTGLKTLKNDGTRHHHVGIEPTHPVLITRGDIEEGFDRTLAVALEALN